MGYSSKVRFTLELDAPQAAACGLDIIRLRKPLTGTFTISVDDEPQARRFEVVRVDGEEMTVKYLEEQK